MVLLKGEDENQAAAVTALRHKLLYTAVYIKQKEN